MRAQVGLAGVDVTTNVAYFSRHARGLVDLTNEAGATVRILGGVRRERDGQRRVRHATRSSSSAGTPAGVSPGHTGNRVATLTAADFAAYTHLPLIRLVSKRIWGEDLLAELDLKPYMALLNEHPAFAKVAQDAKADGPAFAQYIRQVSSKSVNPAV